jgi:hypothetical protein
MPLEKTKTPPMGGDFCETTGFVLGYIFALAGVGFFLTLFAAWRLLLSTLLLSTLLLAALLFLFPALIFRTVARLAGLATLLAHTTLFAFHCHAASPFRTALSLVQAVGSRL